MDTFRMSRRQQLMAFGPALMVIAIMAFVASGASIIPGATAANDVTVNGSVVAGMSISPDTNTAACGNRALSVGDFSDGAFHSSSATCTVQFATNSTNGASLTIRDQDGAAPFFCIVAVCASNNGSLTNASAAAGGAALGDDQFGVSVVTTAGSPAPVAGANFEVDGTPTAAETIWGPVGTSAATVCETSALTVTTHSCELKFGVDGQGATQTAGSYTGTALIEAAAKP